MSKLAKIFFIFTLIMCVFSNMCFAIDESELYNTTNDTDGSIEVNASDETVDTLSQPIEASNDTYTATTPSASTTTVSGVTSISNTSPIANILNIALIVVGVLLILLAIAILIRLGNR